LGRQRERADAAEAGRHGQRLGDGQRRWRHHVRAPIGPHALVLGEQRSADPRAGRPERRLELRVGGAASSMRSARRRLRVVLGHRLLRPARRRRRRRQERARARVHRHVHAPRRGERLHLRQRRRGALLLGLHRPTPIGSR
jgi:hypothetical protein